MRKMLDQQTDAIERLRVGAAKYEAALDPVRRKRLGQFFTGLRLGRILAALAVDSSTEAILDPMAGTGDLLDAALERAERDSYTLRDVDAVEIDSATATECDRRLRPWQSSRPDVRLRVLESDAFASGALESYLPEGYDVVITNPPYVRYQTASAQDETSLHISPSEIRDQLRKVIQSRIDPQERSIWRALVDGYSGLADLSVPAWLLAGALVRPGGRLALVAPATWRSRNYGDVIQYLLARCFRIEFVVEDTQPGWFSDALVRTQLVVARRLPPGAVAVPLSRRQINDAFVLAARISPGAASEDSLLGAAFPGSDPEAAFAEWMRLVAAGKAESSHGISWDVESVSDTASAVLSSVESKKWFRAVEPGEPGILFGDEPVATPSFMIPSAVRAALGDIRPVGVQRPERAGISISQGLRTGCNGFFYVDLIDRIGDEARIRLSELFQHEELVVPFSCLIPVLRRQSEYDAKRSLKFMGVRGHALDLSRWVLPEDSDAVQQAMHLYQRAGDFVPQVMPEALAAYVRRAAHTRYGGESEAKLIPELSAVRTNIRRTGDRPPRFWYMLPPFAHRHRPEVFIPRINQGIPEITSNSSPPVLIDANFSTIWGDSSWSAASLAALLNSSWCRACMEAVGTPMGGGALKLEATQLNQMPVPVLDDRDREWLARAVIGADRQGVDFSTINRFVLGKLFPSAAAVELESVDAKIRSIADTLCANRQKRTA